MRDLFLKGPTFHEDIASASGRIEIIEQGAADHFEGWVFLNERGVDIALKMGLASVKKIRRDNPPVRNHEPQRGLPPYAVGKL